MNEIINFLVLDGKDHKNRKYVDYLGFSDEQLESSHDYIQWMFPLHEASKFAPNCPVLTPEIAKKACGYMNLGLRLEASVKRMSAFYGIGEKNWDINKQREVFFNGNHNMLRITRIIRSLRLLGKEELSKEFFDSVIVASGLAVPEISHITKEYWIKALKDPMWETI